MVIVDFLKEAIKLFYKVLSNDKKRHKKSQFLKIETNNKQEDIYEMLQEGYLLGLKG